MANPSYPSWGSPVTGRDAQLSSSEHVDNPVSGSGAVASDSIAHSATAEHVEPELPADSVSNPLAEKNKVRVLYGSVSHAITPNTWVLMCILLVLGLFAPPYLRLVLMGVLVCIVVAVSVALFRSPLFTMQVHSEPFDKSRLEVDRYTTSQGQVVELTRSKRDYLTTLRDGDNLQCCDFYVRTGGTALNYRETLFGTPRLSAERYVNGLFGNWFSNIAFRVLCFQNVTLSCAHGEKVVFGL